MWKFLITPAAIIAIGLTTGCERAPQGKTVAAAPIPARAPVTLLTAAEPFEALTETAFTASRPQLTATALRAEAAAETVRGKLPAEAARELASRLAQIQTGLQTDNRADVAIASVEAYRILVSAAPRARVPLEVNLLDYAGFRYQADLRAKPARWADMAKAAEFASSQWQALLPRVTDPGLRGRMQGAVRALSLAEAQHDRARADLAAQTQLGLVDELELHFNQPRASL